MSEQPLPPPPLSDPSETIPMAMAFGYAQPARRRPAIITTIGILSIIVASMSLIGSLLSILYAAMFWMMAIVLPASGSGWAFGGFNSGGLMPQETTAVTSALQQSAMLTPRQSLVLSTFLDEHGSSAFTRTSGSLTADAVQKTISSSGTLSGPDGRARATYYVTASGRLEIGDDYAAWYPGAAAPAGSAAQPQGGQALSPSQANTFIVAANRAANQQLTDKHANILRRELTCSSQLLATPSDNAADMNNCIIGVPPADAGGFSVFTNTNAIMYLAPDVLNGLPARGGNSVSYSMQQNVAAPPSTAPSTASVTTQAPTQLHIWALLVIGEGVASLALAVYLLVIGILVFRYSRRGRWQHLLYAGLKIPLAALMSVAWWLLAEALMQTIASRVPAPRPGTPTLFNTGPGIVMAVIAAIICMAYPIGLLIALRTRTVRDYYKTIAT